MAERSFFVLSADPLYLPTDAQRNAALEYFKQVSPLPNANGEYRVHAEDAPILLDAGEGMEAVTCPACEARIELLGEDESAEEWWDEVRGMEVTKDSLTTMPCCEAQVEVLDLTFDMPAYFTRFAIGALEPSYEYEHWKNDDPHNEPQWLSDEAVARFEQLMGGKIHQMWRIGY